MNTRPLAGLFGLALFAQLAVPASMILKRERTLAHGQAFKFRTAPVDPYDAFRGRYVALGFDRNSVAAPPGHDFARGQTVHVRLAEDADGFATFAEILRDRPDAAPYRTTKSQYIGGNVVHLRLPFDRFYMDEDAAPAAEQAYWKYTAASNRNAYVQVRIEKGFAVPEDLYVDGQPIRDYLAAHPQAGAR